MDAIAVTTEQADRYRQALPSASPGPARDLTEAVQVVMEVAQANGMDHRAAASVLAALALTDPESRTRALTTEETDAYLRGHLIGYGAAVETEEGVVIPLAGEEESVLVPFGLSPLAHRCAVCLSALEPSQALPGAYLHVDGARAHMILGALTSTETAHSILWVRIPW